jgi:hypothetical protein
MDYHSKGLTSPVRKKYKMFEIRQAHESDIRDLADLDNECFDTYYYKRTKFSESDFQAYLYHKKSILIVAVRDSCLVGYVAGTLRKLLAYSFI